ncbi:Cyclic AMP receptor-like protein [bioreactor metagenome]|uniref:Cyclic AMP receptor-like protein n=1 Tax=bioreactor metagenome TaxID=1076179 RepID=A0A645DKC4_9ZZZZ
MNQKMEAIWSQFDVSYGVALDLLPQALLVHTARKIYLPEEVIVSEGDSLQYVYYIESGVVDGMKRFESGKDYHYFKLDRFNGAIGLLELFSRQSTIIATIVAKTKVSILCIPADELYVFAMNDLPLLRKISYHIANDLYRDSGLNGKLFYLNGVERVCYYLADYFKKNSYPQMCVEVKQNYQTIANHIGVSQRTVGRAICDLRAQGLCTIRGKHVRITREQYEQIRSSQIPQKE